MKVDLMAKDVMRSKQQHLRCMLKLWRPSGLVLDLCYTKNADEKVQKKKTHKTT